MKFVFPEPGPLEGVKSRSKVILRHLDELNRDCWMVEMLGEMRFHEICDRSKCQEVSPL